MTPTPRPGAAPFSHVGGPAGVLILHGFTGSPHSMRPVAEALAAAGATVELPLLPGHGTDVADMVPTRWPDWSEAADAAYRDLAGRCPAVAVVGLSMGGGLACWLAAHHPEIRGLVLINPLVEPPEESLRALLISLVEQGTDLAPGIGNDIAKAGADELGYAETPVAAALSLFDGVEGVAALLDRITCPVLLLSSREDHVVPSSGGDRLVATVAGPVDRVWLEHSYHVATLDHDADLVTAATVDFVSTVLGSSR